MEILNDLREREKFPPHIFIWNDENYSDEFMLVINKFPEDNSIPLPDPVRVHQCAMESISKNRDGTPKRDSGGDYLLKKALNGRATLATDIGVTGSQANKRGNCLDDDGSGNHHSKPPMLKFTYEYSDILRSCSLVASSPVLKPSWIPVGQELYTIDGHPEYVTEFSGTLSNGEGDNIVPTAWCDIVPYQDSQRCNDHHDGGNGKSRWTEIIGGISWNLSDGQLRLNFSSRDSREGYTLRETQQDKILEDMRRKYLLFPLQQRYITASLSKGSAEKFLPGFVFNVQPCHLHPSGYYSLCIYCQELLF